MDNEMINIVLKVLSAVGGIGVILWAIVRFGGRIFETLFKERARTDAEIEIDQAKQKLGPSRLRADRFAVSQFEVYHGLWKSLAALKSAGDDLWRKANSANIQLFARQLRETTKTVEEGAIFFVDRDYVELQALLNVFAQYQIGKKRLVDIRSSADLDNNSNRIHHQIEDNGQHKREYEAILERVRLSFRRRLSSIEEAEVVPTK